MSLLAFLARTAVLIPCLIAVPVSATSFMLRPFPETVERSTIIARGTTGASHTRWGRLGGQERIFTYTELEVVEVLKGSMGESRSTIVRELGGEKDGIAMDVSGTAKFRRGEDVVLMLKGPNPDGSYDVRGLMMGKLQVTLDERGDEILSGPALGRPGVVHDDEAGQGDTGESQDSGGRLTLERLRELIRSQAASAESGQIPGNKDESGAEVKGVEKRTVQAPGLQSREPEGASEHVGNQQGQPVAPHRISLKFIAFALAAILLFGAVMAFLWKGRRG